MLEPRLPWSFLRLLARQQAAKYDDALRRYVTNEESETQAKQDYWQQVSVRSIGKIERVSLAEVFWIEAQANSMQ